MPVSVIQKSCNSYIAYCALLQQMHIKTADILAADILAADILAGQGYYGWVWLSRRTPSETCKVEFWGGGRDRRLPSVCAGRQWCTMVCRVNWRCRGLVKEFSHIDTSHIGSYGGQWSSCWGVVPSLTWLFIIITHYSFTAAVVVCLELSCWHCPWQISLTDQVTGQLCGAVS